MAILRKEFERQYGVDLLPVSAADIRLGDIWDWEGLFHPKLKRLMTNVALLGQSNTDLYGRLGAAQNVDSSIPDVELKDNMTLNGDLKIPSLNVDLSDDLSANAVSSFKFQGVISKSTNGILQNDIIQFLTGIKSSNYSLFADNVKHNQVAVWLFYASSVSLTVDNTVSNKAAIEAKLRSIPGINLNVDTSNAGSVVYSINGSSDCPFAAQFMKGREF
jgi:hypothetical protein